MTMAAPHPSHKAESSPRNQPVTCRLADLHQYTSARQPFVSHITWSTGQKGETLLSQWVVGGMCVIWDCCLPRQGLLQQTEASVSHGTCF